MKQQAKVLRIKDKNTLEVESIAHEECHKCGGCLLSDKKSMTFSGNIPEDIMSGDTIEIEIESGYLIFAYFLFYGFPLLMFFPFLLFAFRMTMSPLISFACGVLGVLIVYMITGAVFKKQHNFLRNIKIRKIED